MHYTLDDEKHWHDLSKEKWRLAQTAPPVDVAALARTIIDRPDDTSLHSAFIGALSADAVLRPRMLVMHDCIDRDATVENTAALLKLHGVPARPWQCKEADAGQFPSAELLEPDEDCFVEHQLVSGGALHALLVRATAQAAASHSALLIKVKPDSLTSEAANVLLAMGTQPASIWRQRPLDHLLCR